MSPQPSSLEISSEPSSKDTEIDYALILSQMIEVAEEDPSQLRLAIYEFARTKLINNTLGMAEAERDRLSKSLEAAIVGVEKFAKLRGRNKRRIVFRHGGAELFDDSRPAESPSALQNTVSDAARIQAEPLVNRRSHFTSILRTFLQKMLTWGRQPNWFAVGLSCFVAAIVLIVLVQESPLWRKEKKLQSALSAQNADNSTSVDPAAKQTSPELPSPLGPGLPLPENYGVYLLNGLALLELDALETRVPDRRIEMSTPVSVVHQKTITNGAPRFLIYRRDLANDPTDKFDVRPLARIERAISFDPKGKPIFSPSASTWIIRNIAYEFRVRPVPGHPEMILVQAKEGAVDLPAGRYVLALKDKGFDFNVAGEVTDPAQCVERTDAVNGSFYSDCQKR